MRRMSSSLTNGSKDTNPHHDVNHHHYLQSRSSSFNQLVHVQLSRHEHPLVELSLPNLFTCMGCKEFGAGRRFSCQTCNFELHDFCATAPPNIKLHPLHPQHQLLLHLPKPSGGGLLKSKCEICSKPTKGYAYRCIANNCNYQLHPTCSLLSPKMEFPSHPLHPLLLLPSDHSSGAGGRSLPCGECKRMRRSGQAAYSCTAPDCDYLLHANCAKTMVNGLYANGYKNSTVDDHHKDKSNRVLGAAVRIASHVVIGFIGGLVEGIGEGVGDALAQNVVGKGDRSRSSRSPIRAPVVGHYK